MLLKYALSKAFVSPTPYNKLLRPLGEGDVEAGGRAQTDVQVGFSGEAHLKGSKFGGVDTDDVVRIRQRNSPGYKYKDSETLVYRYVIWGCSQIHAYFSTRELPFFSFQSRRIL